MEISLQAALALGAVSIIFIKKDGSERTILATTNPTHFTYQNKNSSKPKNPNVVAVWDIMNSGWRSIRLDSVKEWTYDESFRQA